MVFLKKAWLGLTRFCLVAVGELLELKVALAITWMGVYLLGCSLGKMCAFVAYDG
jgi:hypothetical protein